MKREIAGKDSLIEELHHDYQDKITELKEKYELEKNALELQNKKLKQDEDLVMRHRSDMLLRPLLNELNSMNLNFEEKSPLFETFKNTSLEFDHGEITSEKELEDESEALKKELERMMINSQQNIKRQESVKLLRRNSMLELENLINIYKTDMLNLKDETTELKAKLEEKTLENERKAVLIEENVKKLEEAEAKNSEIEQKIKETHENYIVAEENIQKLERVINACKEIDENIKGNMIEGLNICRTRYYSIYCYFCFLHFY